MFVVSVARSIGLDTSGKRMMEPEFFELKQPIPTEVFQRQDRGDDVTGKAYGGTGDLGPVGIIRARIRSLTLLDKRPARLFVTDSEWQLLQRCGVPRTMENTPHVDGVRVVRIGVDVKRRGGK